MSLTDFDGCTPQQFTVIYEAWQEREERRRRDGWEQSRFVVCGLLQPYSKKVIGPEDVCVFSWEKEIAGQARNDGNGGSNDGNGGRNGGTGGNDGNGGDDGDGGDEIAGQARNDDRERAKKIRELWCK